ncbi:MAG: hypothetical protein B7Y39_16175 [Bdellovibrio sp. 28-41-41]|nr:MAG: hypothetical protein B7Y39_16175 [Bdellovibrio sp. 28-41-41]
MKLTAFLFLIFALVVANASEDSKRNDLKRWEFRTAPVALIASWYTVDISYRTSERLSTGPAVVIYGASAQGNMFLPSYNGSAVGWQMNYYFDTVRKNTWYLGSHAYFEKYNSYPHAAQGFSEHSGYRINTTIGYKVKNAGILSMFGIGVEYRDQNITRTEDSQINVDSHEANFFPVLELKMGFEI